MQNIIHVTVIQLWWETNRNLSRNRETSIVFTLTGSSVLFTQKSTTLFPWHKASLKRKGDLDRYIHFFPQQITPSEDLYGWTTFYTFWILFELESESLFSVIDFWEDHIFTKLLNSVEEIKSWFGTTWGWVKDFWVNYHFKTILSIRTKLVNKCHRF